MMRKKIKIKNFALKTITNIACANFVFAACILDSEYWIQSIVSMVISVIWIFLFIFANRERCWRLVEK